MKGMHFILYNIQEIIQKLLANKVGVNCKRLSGENVTEAREKAVIGLLKHLYVIAQLDDNRHDLEELWTLTKMPNDMKVMLYFIVE